MHRKTMAAVSVIASLSFALPAFAQSGKSSGEIAAASRLLAEQREHCRVEANRQHLHLLKRRKFIRVCMKREQEVD